MRNVRDLMYHYWKDEVLLKDYFIFHLFVHMVRDAYPEMWETMPVFNNVSPHILQFEMYKSYNEVRWNEIRKMSDFHKLNHHYCHLTNTASGKDGSSDTFLDRILKMTDIEDFHP